jgi:hypothetical protein
METVRVGRAVADGRVAAEMRAGGLAASAAYAVAVLLVPPAAAQSADTSNAPIEIKVSHLAPGAWHVEYLLPRPVDRLTFLRARTTFRRTDWSLETPGLQLVLNDSLDRIDAAGRTFERVAVRFGSDPTKHEREYILTPGFSDGSEGLYTGLLYVAAERNGQRLAAPTVLHIRPAAGERVLIHGEVSDSATGWRDDRGAGTYAYFGAIEPTTSPRVLAIVDPGLPAHLREMFESQLPALFDHFSERLGYALERRPLILIGFTPSDRAGLSSHGDVLPGLIRFGFEGRGWRDDSDEVRRRAFYLLAHEAAHLWNGELFESSESGVAPWMHEGSAEAFAWLAMREFGVLDDAGLLATVEDALNECLFLTRGMAWGAPEAMRRPRVPYACGGALNMIMHAGLAGRGGLYAFWGALFSAADSAGGEYDAAMFQRVLASSAGDGAIHEVVRSLLTDSLASESHRLVAELGRAGVQAQAGAAPRTRTSSQFAVRAMMALMQGDCGGRYSIAADGQGLRVNGFDQCRSLPATQLLVTALEGRSLVTDPAAAYAAVVERCNSGEVVLVSVSGGDALEVPCQSRLPSYVRLTSIGR